MHGDRGPLVRVVLEVAGRLRKWSTASDMDEVFCHCFYRLLSTHSKLPMSARDAVFSTAMNSLTKHRCCCVLLEFAAYHLGLSLPQAACCKAAACSKAGGTRAPEAAAATARGGSPSKALVRRTASLGTSGCSTTGSSRPRQEAVAVVRPHTCVTFGLRGLPCPRKLHRHQPPRAA